MAEAAQALDPTGIDAWKNPLAPAAEKPALESTTKPEAKPEMKPEPPAEKIDVPSLIGKIGKGAEEAGEKVRALDAEAMKLTPPTPKSVPQSAAPLTSPVEIWGSAAMILAGIGSLMTRRPMVTALNAASNVLDAYKAKDLEAANRAFKVWEAENHNATQAFNFQQQAYKAALGDIHTKKEEALKTGAAKDKAVEARVKALMTAFEDVGGIAAYNEGGLPGFARFQEAQRAQLTKQSAATENILMRQRVLQLQQTDEYKAASTAEKLRMKDEAGDPGAHKIRLAEQAKEVSRASADEVSDADYKTAQALAVYAEDEKNIPLKDGKRTRAENIARELNPAWLPGNARNAAMARNSWTDPKGAGFKQISSFATVTQHLATADSLIDDLNNNPNFPLFNKVAQSLGFHVGATAKSNMDVARHIIGTEIVKATAGVPGGVTERVEAANILSAARTPPQLYEAVEVVRELIGGRMSTARALFTAGTREPPENFDKMLPETTRKVFGEFLRGESSMASAPTGAEGIEERKKIREESARRRAEERLRAPEKGGVAKTGEAKAAGAEAKAAGTGKAPPEDLLAGAKKAISSGAPRDAVIKRLQDAGYDTSGL